MRHIKYAFIIPILLLIGCGPSKTVKPNAVGAVSVDPHVQVTTNPELLSGVAPLLTPYSESEKEKHRQYKRQLEEGKIDVGAIVRKEFLAALSQHPAYGPKLKVNGPYKFVVSVPYHALVQQTTFSDKYAANVGIEVVLLAPDGTVLFKSTAQSCIFSKCVTPYTLPELKSNPSLLDEQYREASKDAVSEVVSEL